MEAVADEAVQREVLPIPDQSYPGVVTYDARSPDTKFPPIGRLLPPAGAPNVLVVLIDDVGFGASSAFGGPVNAPGRSSSIARAGDHRRNAYPWLSEALRPFTARLRPQRGPCEGT